jgi:hypothetical protein
MLTSLIACSSSSSDKKGNETKTAAANPANNNEKEFTKYMKAVQPTLISMSESSKKYESVRSQSANGEISDEEFGQKLSDEVLPNYTKIQDDLEDVLPPKNLRSTHEILLKAISKNNEGMTEILSAINTGDASKITSANALLSEGRKAERDYVYKIQDLADKYGLEFDN